MARDRFDHTFESSVDPKPERPRRIEVITGPDRRRTWADDEKIRIVAASLEPHVNVSAVARQHGVNPQQLFGWRKTFRGEAEALIGERTPEPPAFVPAVVVPEAPIAPAAAADCDAVQTGSIEISVGSASVRVRGCVDGRTLALVLKALKALS